MLTAAGADRVLTMDLHAAQIQGFFDIPVDNLLGNPVFVDYYAKKFGERLPRTWSSSPPTSAPSSRARTFAQKLHMSLAIVDKRRQKANQCEVMNVIGDVRGQGLHPLRRHGRYRRLPLQRRQGRSWRWAARKTVYACASHGVLSGPAHRARSTTAYITELALARHHPRHARGRPATRSSTCTVAPMFAEAIERIYQEISIAKLFN